MSSRELTPKESKDIASPERGRIPASFEEMERWFDEIFRRPFFTPSWFPGLRTQEQPAEFIPSVDIFEDGNDMVVKAEIPGMRKEDLDVNLTGNSIAISGHKSEEKNVDRTSFHRFERSFGSFSRRFTLPDGVQSDKAKAVFKDGVLEVRIPKAPGASSRKVKIE